MGAGTARRGVLRCTGARSARPELVDCHLEQTQHRTPSARSYPLCPPGVIGHPDRRLPGAGDSNGGGRSGRAHPMSKSAIAKCVEHQVIDATTDLDHTIFRDGLFDLSLDEQLALRDTYVREAVLRNLSGCPAYAAFARKQGFVADGAAFDVRTIPV